MLLLYSPKSYRLGDGDFRPAVCSNPWEKHSLIRKYFYKILGECILWSLFSRRAGNSMRVQIFPCLFSLVLYVRQSQSWKISRYLRAERSIYRLENLILGVTIYWVSREAPVKTTRFLIITWTRTLFFMEIWDTIRKHIGHKLTNQFIYLQLHKSNLQKTC